ncbi:FAD dependent oxidoreductase-domain-containing protein [Diplogelasinospora grovesii]|uniref:FAD dependent oxidoreductase-domain-containing protein n=1 Tax=Diplogelasinospora grovesii TaxID=303347 RepID=A0AAN6N4X1_9PEZI|nr:FAD dependent oxidoreductase-domain-containing protein [Diplogelasinospora grovesii]
MGGILSSLASAFKGLKTVIAVLRGLSADYNDLLNRANAPPGLPVSDPTVAYWQEDPPYPELVDIHSPELPECADVVIIGSGITGAAIARTILHESRRQGIKRRVVVCEARTLCSGATGRNGGHIKASPHEVFGRLRKRMEPERAAALVRFQLRHLEALLGLCKDEGIDIAECREVETVDLFVDQKHYEQAIKEVEDLRKWVPEFDMSVWSGTEAQKKFGVNNQIKGAISYKAGALWPYRFVTSIWKQLLDEFPESLSIETSTPVTAVSTGGTMESPYIVSTRRHGVWTRHVVHATNAFASHLVPGLRGKTAGMLAHMSAQSPGNKFPDLNGQRSWSIMYASSGFDYITQRPTVDGVPGNLMLGGGFMQSAKQGVDFIGVYDDSKEDALTNAHNLGVMPTIFGPSNWGYQRGDGDLEADKTWSGVIAIAADFVPLVGRLDARLTGRKINPKTYRSLKGGEKDMVQDEPGEWIAAAFVGDGMVWAWLSGSALGIMLSGSENDDLAPAPGRPSGRLKDWFPEELLPTYERVKKMQLSDLAGEIM